MYYVSPKEEFKQWNLPQHFTMAAVLTKYTSLLWASLVATNVVKAAK